MHYYIQCAGFYKHAFANQLYTTTNKQYANPNVQRHDIMTLSPTEQIM